MNKAFFFLLAVAAFSSPALAKPGRIVGGEIVKYDCS